jgi:hypothetical protein
VIDWSAIDKTKPADWTSLAQLLMQKAVAVIQAAQRPPLEELQGDLQAFVMAATSKCPPAALSAVNTSSRQVTAAALAIDLADLQTRSARLDAAGAKVSAIAGSVREEELKLRLANVKRVLDELNGLTADLMQFRAEIDGIPKKDVPARIETILALLSKIQRRAQAV